MKYWEEFQSKWGFGDGDSIPPDAWALRYVYVREINREAVKRNSSVRLFAFDRPGMHNPYLILRAPVGLVKGIPEADLCKGSNAGGWKPPMGDWEEPDADEGMLEAIDYVAEGEGEKGNPDGLVSVTVCIDDEPELERVVD